MYMYIYYSKLNSRALLRVDMNETNSSGLLRGETAE